MELKQGVSFVQQVGLVLKLYYIDVIISIVVSVYCLIWTNWHLGINIKIAFSARLIHPARLKVKQVFLLGRPKLEDMWQGEDVQFEENEI